MVNRGCEVGVWESGEQAKDEKRRWTEGNETKNPNHNQRKNRSSLGRRRKEKGKEKETIRNRGRQKR